MDAAGAVHTRLLACGVAVAVLSAAGCCPNRVCGLFSYPSPYSAGFSLLIAADVNRDGALDLIGVGGGAFSSNTVALLGRGDGTFRTPLISPLPGIVSPSDLAVGDFDGDGELDVMVAGYSLPSSITPDALLLQRGFGNGAFSPPTTIPGVPSPLTLAASDFNGDGKLDVAVGEFVAQVNGTSLYVLFGDGHGGFANSWSAELGTVMSMGTGDFDGDGTTDLIAMGSPAAPGGVVPFLSSAGGALTAGVPPTLPPTLISSVLATGDFDHSGSLDVALTDVTQSGGVAVLLGKGDGTFTMSPVSEVSFQRALTLAAADFDQDGHLDIATADVATGNARVALGRGDGTFDLTIQLSYCSAAPTGANFGGSEVRNVAVGDFNGDGKPDLAMAAPCDGNAVVWLNSDAP